MGWIRSEEEVDKMIEEMKSKGSGKYITQGVTFSKDSERHMELLKYALMSATSFSALAKELLAEKFEGKSANLKKSNNPTVNHTTGDTGNFF